jgi:transposase
VNPATTKRNKENRDNSPSKNDPKDALVIADVVSRGYYSDYTRQGHVFQRLRIIMSDREFWVANSVRLQNRVIRWLDIRFPEYPSVFKDWTSQRSLATLKEFPTPQDVQTLTVDQVIPRWKKHMKGPGGASGIQRASSLIYEAKQSVGDTTALIKAKQDLQRLLEQYESVSKMLEKIEKNILSLLGEIPLAEQLRTIKGFGPIATATILASAGDLKQYAHGRQLLRRTGLNLAESTSGKRKGQIVLSKRGDANVRSGCIKKIRFAFS